MPFSVQNRKGVYSVSESMNDYIAELLVSGKNTAKPLGSRQKPTGVRKQQVSVTNLAKATINVAFSDGRK